MANEAVQNQEKAGKIEARGSLKPRAPETEKPTQDARLYARTALHAVVFVGLLFRRHSHYPKSGVDMAELLELTTQTAGRLWVRISGNAADASDPTSDAPNTSAG